MNADQAMKRLSHLAAKLKGMDRADQPRKHSSAQKRILRRFWRAADRSVSLLTPNLPPMREGSRKARTLY